MTAALISLLCRASESSGPDFRVYQLPRGSYTFPGRQFLFPCAPSAVAPFLMSIRQRGIWILAGVAQTHTVGLTGSVRLHSFLSASDRPGMCVYMPTSTKRKCGERANPNQTQVVDDAVLSGTKRTVQGVRERKHSKFLTLMQNVLQRQRRSGSRRSGGMNVCNSRSANSSVIATPRVSDPLIWVFTKCTKPSTAL